MRLYLFGITNEWGELLDQLNEYQLKESASPLQIQTSTVDVSKKNVVRI
jgi:hypothetical protein